MFEKFEREEFDKQVAMDIANEERDPDMCPGEQDTPNHRTSNKDATHVDHDEPTNSAVNQSCGSKESLPVERSIEATIEEMGRRLSRQVAVAYDEDGDTLVFIDPPPRQPEQDELAYREYNERYKIPLRMSKKHFDALNSPFFVTAFGPTSQYRLRRRRGLVGTKLPDGIKYLIDLTPPTEGDDAVYLTTELCCSERVRKWYQAGQRWRVSDTLTGGLEEATLVEYSPIQHRSAIECVLAAISGQDPKLNSAPKVWMTFAVAKYFEITDSLLTDYIVRWLCAAPNSLFLEVMPELSLRIVDGLQCFKLSREVFAILVGEEALANVYHGRDSHTGSLGFGYNTHGRKKDDLPELYRTRIEYASKGFVERVSAEFASLVGQMDWFSEIPELCRLRTTDFTSSAQQAAAVELETALKKYVRGWVNRILCSTFKAMPGPAEDSWNGDDDLFPTSKFRDTWDGLVPKERIFTQSFWKALQACEFSTSGTNMDFYSNSVGYTPSDEWSEAVQSYRDSKTLEEVSYQSLKGLCKQFLLQSDPLSPLHTLSSLHAFDNLAISSSENEQPGPLAPGTVDPQKSSFFIPRSWWKDEPEHRARPDFFDLSVFFGEAKGYIRKVCGQMLAGSTELVLTNTLICLEDSELKYLPLWAGGNDDGSGGVFDGHVPSAEVGFSTAGPNVHIGTSTRSSLSDFDMVDGNTEGSTFHTSTAVNDGISDSMDRRRVYDADSDSLWNHVRAHNNAISDFSVLGTGNKDTATLDTATLDGSMFHVKADEKDDTDDKGKENGLMDAEDCFDDVFDPEEDEFDDGDTEAGDAHSLADEDEDNDGNDDEDDDMIVV